MAKPKASRGTAKPKASRLAGKNSQKRPEDLKQAPADKLAALIEGAKKAIQEEETESAMVDHGQKQLADPAKADSSIPPAEPLPGNEDGELIEGDLSFAAERREMLRKHVEQRKALTGNKPPEWVEVIYCESNDSYLYKQPGTPNFFIAPEKKITRDLRRFGLSDKWRPPTKVVYPNGVERTETPWTELDWPTCNAFAHRRVYYAGSLPGHRMGQTFDSNGRKLYVIEQSPVWNPAPELTAEDDPEKFFFTELAVRLLGATQSNHFFYLMAAWLVTLLEGAWTPGPVLWLVGKKDYGKSLLIEGIKFLFGGRSADPSNPLLFKDKNFNGHLLAGEIWAMDDPHLSPAMEDRIRLANRMKTFFHARPFTFEDKGQRAFTVNCWRRSVNGINDQHADLKGMPPMRPGVTDKHCINRCQDARESWESRFFRQRGLPLNGETQHERLDQSAMIEQLKREAPLMRVWLMKTFQNVPPRWRDSRYGVAPIQHLELMRELAELSPEAYFLSCIDEVIFDADPKAAYPEFIYSEPENGNWRQEKVSYPYVLATSKEIESRLMRSDFARRVEHQLRSTHKILEQLVEFYPERVIGPDQIPMRNGSNRWRINNPFRMETQTNEDQHDHRDSGAHV